MKERKKMKERKWRTILVGMLMFVCSTFAINMGQKSTVYAADDVFEMTAGGSIRIIEPYGLRFQVKMSESIKEKASEVGMFIFPADYLVDTGATGDIYYENVEQLIQEAPESHRINLNLTNKLFKMDGYWYGNGAIVNIKEKNMSREFVGIAYYKVNGETVWADTSKVADTTRSAAQVALMTHADKTGSYSDESKQLLVNYIDYLKAANVDDSAPTRYKVRGYASSDGLRFRIVQYVDNVVEMGDKWKEQTHLEAQIWHDAIGMGATSGFSTETYGAFWLDGTYEFDNNTNITSVTNDVTITDRGESYTKGYRYEVCYEIYMEFNNNSEDGPYAYVQFKHHVPGETPEGFEYAYQEHRNKQRYLWQENCVSYELRRTGIRGKDLQYQNLGTIGGDDVATWDLNVFRAKNAFYTKLTTTDKIDSTVVTGVNLSMNLGEYNTTRTENTYEFALATINGMAVCEVGSYPEGTYKEITDSQVGCSTTSSNGQTTLYMTIPYDIFTESVKNKEIAINFRSSCGDKVADWVYRDCKVAWEQPTNYMTVTKDNEVFLLGEKAVQATLKENQLLKEGYENVFANLATISVDSGALATVKDTGKMFSDKPYYFETVETDFIKGKTFAYNEFEESTFYVEKGGYMFLMSSGNEEKLEEEGWKKQFIDWNQIDSMTDTTISYYAKWCDAGEEHSYQEWCIPIAARELRGEDEVYSEEVLSLIKQPVAVNFEPDDYYYQNYRYFAMSASMEITDDGRLWSCWIGGEDNAGAYLVATYSDDKGETWEDIQFVIDPHDDELPLIRNTHIGCFWQDPKGRLWLFYQQSFGMWDGEGANFAIVCDDPDAEKPTWSEPKYISIGASLKKPIVTSKGEWLLPVSIWERWHISAPLQDCHTEWDDVRGAMVYASTDEGESWTYRGGVIFDDSQYNEHSLVELSDGRIMMYSRCSNAIKKSYSSDGGRTWTPQEVAFPHVGSLAMIRKLPNGHILLIKHGSSFTEATNGRNNLTAFISKDDGVTWQGGLLLDERLWVSYPDIAIDSDGTIYVYYDYTRTTEAEILFARFTEEDVLAGEFKSENSGTKFYIKEKTGIKGHPVTYGETSEFKGSGTVTDPYQIGTVAEWKYLAQQVADGTTYWGCYFKQTANIDFAGENIQPVGHYLQSGSHIHAFQGHFDGNGYKFTNFKQIAPELHCRGLFGYINAGSIKNVIVENATIKGLTNTGAIVGFAEGNSSSRPIITGCKTGDNVSVIGYWQIGGLVGRATGYVTINDCENNASVSIPYCSGNRTINVGGIVGYSENRITIRYCTNNGSVSVRHGLLTYIGGISSNNKNGYILDCINNGEIIVDCNVGATYVGGISAWNSATTVDRCVNNGMISVDATREITVGGIVGFWGKDDSINNIIQNSYITGDIDIRAYDQTDTILVGGVVGRASSSETSTTSRMSNAIFAGNIITVTEKATITSGSLIGHYVNPVISFEDNYVKSETAIGKCDSTVDVTSCCKVGEDSVQDALTQLKQEHAAWSFATKKVDFEGFGTYNVVNSMVNNYANYSAGKITVKNNGNNSYAKMQPMENSGYATITRAAHTNILKKGTYKLSMDVKLGSGADGKLSFGIYNKTCGWVPGYRKSIDISNATTDSWTTVTYEYTFAEDKGGTYANLDIGYQAITAGENNYVLIDNIQVIDTSTNSNADIKSKGDFEGIVSFPDLTTTGWKRDSSNSDVIYINKSLENQMLNEDGNICFKFYTSTSDNASATFAGGTAFAEAGLYKMSAKVKLGAGATKVDNIGFRFSALNNMGVGDVSFDGLDAFNSEEWVTLETYFTVTSTVTTNYINMDFWAYTHNDEVGADDNYVLIDDIKVEIVK